MGKLIGLGEGGGLLLVLQPNTGVLTGQVGFTPNKVITSFHLTFPTSPCEVTCTFLGRVSSHLMSTKPGYTPAD